MKKIEISTIEDLAYLIREAKEQNLPQPIVFLGAGASKTGGIPLAGEIVENILDRYKKNPQVKELIAMDKDKTYPALMECLTPYERNKLLKDYIDSAKINVTHIYLAQFINEGYIDYVLTVNFDNLMLRALALYNEFPPTYDMAILKDLTTTTFKEKSVVYLHGQHHGLWLLNTPEEMNKVKERIPTILHSIKDRPWIFIGYSGEDPIFKQIVRLGRFDKGLYWISYYDAIPNETVCKKLLEKDNTNSFLIKGYDSDSFMIKLNNELELPQPFIIEKPFTSLKTSLENIVDIDDKDHFKGVRERLVIVKQQVEIAIEQFEQGKIQTKEHLEEEIDRNLLKKQIIDKIVNEEFDEIPIKSLDDKAKKLRDTDINNILANLYLYWAIRILKEAELKNDEALVRQSIDKCEIAAELNPKDYLTFYNLGTAIICLAKLRKDVTLYQQGFEKFEKATELNPKYQATFYNWGTSIADLGILLNDEALIQQSFEKFEKANELNPKNDTVFFNWGNAILSLANLKKDEVLYQQSIEKYEKATESNPKDDTFLINFGNAICYLAELRKDEVLYQQSFEKFEKANELNPKNDTAFSAWGGAIASLAKLKNDTTLYKQGFEKYEKAAELNPKNGEIFYSWGGSILNLAKLKNDDAFFQQSIEKSQKGVKLGSSPYNLACAYALKKEKNYALKYLGDSLLAKHITVEFVEADEDWEMYKDDREFINLLNKYRT